MPAKRQAKSVHVAFGAQLRLARLSAGQTQQSLAERADIDPVFVSFLENGHRQPSLVVLLALERSLGLRPGELARRTAKALDGAGEDAKPAATKRRKKA